MRVQITFKKTQLQKLSSSLMFKVKDKKLSNKGLVKKKGEIFWRPSRHAKSLFASATLSYEKCENSEKFELSYIVKHSHA